MSIGLSVNKEKIGILLAYLCSRIPNMHLRKLLKILYLIDEESVRQRAIPVTWLDYYAWIKGPVAPEVYNIKNGAFSDYVLCERKENGKWYTNAFVQHAYQLEEEMKIFSQWEIGLIDSIIAQYKDKTAEQLTDETHTPQSLWSKVVAENHIDFDNNPETDYRIDLNRLNESEYSKATYEDAEDCMKMQAFLNACC